MTGEETGIMFGFIDEGGHRREEVHYICKHLPFLRPYKGESSAKTGNEHIKQSENDIHYMGDTHYWSELLQTYIQSDTWHLPEDVSTEYLEQLPKQYTIKETDKNGKVTYTWISGGNDHYRDCENYVLAAAHAKKFHLDLNKENKLEEIKTIVNNRVEKIKEFINNSENLKPAQEIKPKIDPTSYRDKRNQVFNPFQRRIRR